MPVKGFRKIMHVLDKVGGGEGGGQKIENEMKYIYGVHPSPSSGDVDRLYEVHLPYKGGVRFSQPR